MLILDAFSSDPIPVHLITREALALYQQHLAPNGLLVFHISNFHLNLEPVLANLARDPSLESLVRDDTVVSPEEVTLGKSPSIWLVMARQTSDFASLTTDSRWHSPRQIESPGWTDRYSSVLGVLRW
jgi:hypothetical protein